MSDVRSTPELTAASAHGVRWVSLARVAAELLLLGSMVILAHLIPPADFGRFAIAVIVTELALSIPGEGVGSALVQRRDVSREHLQAGGFLTLVAGVGLLGLTLLGAPALVTPVFGEPTARLVELAAPMFLVAALGTVPMALLRRRLDFRRLSVIDISGSIVRSGGAVVLAAAAGLNAEALVLGALAGTVATTVLAIAFAPAPLPRPRLAPIRDIIGYGLPASLASVSWVGFRNGDYAIVGARLGAAQAGFYWRAFQLAVEYQRKISMVMYTIAFPVLSRSASHDEMFALRGRMVRLLTVVLFPLLAGLAILAPYAVPWLFGERWEPAVLPTQILCAAGAATLVIDAVGTTLMAAGRPRALLGYGVAHFGAYASAAFVVAPLGIAAVAGAAATVHLIFLIVAYVMLLDGRVREGMRCLWRDVAPAAVSCAALLGVAVPVGQGVAALSLPGVLDVLVVACVAAPVYLLTLRKGFPAAWSDLLTLVRRVVPGRILSRLTLPMPLRGARSSS